MPVLVQCFKCLSQTAITTTLHFSVETRANGDDPEREGFFTITFHHAPHFQTGTAPLNRHFWEQCCSRSPEHRVENTDSTVFSPFFFKTPFLVFFSSCGPHYSRAANDSQESHNQWVLPVSIQTGPALRSPFAAHVWLQ